MTATTLQLRPAGDTHAAPTNGSLVAAAPAD